MYTLVGISLIATEQQSSKKAAPDPHMRIITVMA